MIKIMIVDDEIHIREGLRDCILWERYGLTITSDAPDGERALDLFINNPVDIIITDIKMPFLDGLGLIEEVRKMNRNTHFIIISGYDDFKYAQKALAHGASGYILKPIEVPDLLDLLEKVTIDICNARSEKNLVQQLKKDSVHRQLQIQIKDLLYNRGSEGERRSWVKHIRSVLHCPERCHYSILVFQIDNLSEIRKKTGLQYEYVVSESYQLIHNSLKTSFPSCVFIEGKDNKIIILSFGRKQVVLHSLQSEISSFLLKYIKVTFGWTISVAIGRSDTSLNDIHLGFNNALNQFERRFIEGNDKTLSSDNFINIQSVESQEQISKCIEKIILELKIGGKEELLDEILNFKRLLIQHPGNSRSFIQAGLSSVFLKAMDLFKELHLENDSLIREGIGDLERMFEMETLADEINILCLAMLKFKNYLSRQKTGNYHTEIEKAKDYIGLNYKDPHLKLENVARHIGLSTSYFSTMFKQNTGCTFIDYLMQFRIEKAKVMLLTTHYRVYEISYKTGYNNPTYFNRRFKMLTGMTPNEFKNQMIVS